jgi:hypothetical protein
LFDHVVFFDRCAKWLNTSSSYTIGFVQLVELYKVFLQRRLWTKISPLSSKYCCVLKKLVFPTPGTPEITKNLRVWFNHSKKVNLFYLLSINSTSDFKTFKGLVSYGLSLNPVLFHKFLGHTKYLVCLVQSSITRLYLK